ncbi:MAG: hypothetical protein WCD70_12185 [Alphaproteobacteria bacterium]
MTLKLIPRLFLTLSALALVPFALSACGTLIDDDTVAANPPPRYVQQTPPQEPQFEITPVIQDPQHEIWRSGYWALIGPSFVWVPGKIIPRPWPTAVWAKAHWTKHEYGWSFQQGHWE